MHTYDVLLVQYILYIIYYIKKKNFSLESAQHVLSYHLIKVPWCTCRQWDRWLYFSTKKRYVAVIQMFRMAHKDTNINPKMKVTFHTKAGLLACLMFADAWYTNIVWTPFKLLWTRLIGVLFNAHMSWNMFH